MKPLWIIAVLLLTALLLFSCALPPAPTDAQILRAIKAHEEEAEPPHLVYEEMEVSIRVSGRAGAVLWVPDKSIQRNYMIAYDRKEKAFYVSEYSTSVRMEDGSYRIWEESAPR